MPGASLRDTLRLAGELNVTQTGAQTSSSSLSQRCHVKAAPGAGSGSS